MKRLIDSGFAVRDSAESMLSKIASSSRSREVSCSSPRICCASLSCAVRSIDSLLSAAFATARSRSSSARVASRSRRAALSSCSTSLRSNPANLRPASYIHAASAAEQASTRISPSQRRYHATSERTATRGAAMPKRRRSFRNRLVIATSR